MIRWNAAGPPSAIGHSPRLQAVDDAVEVEWEGGPDVAVLLHGARRYQGRERRAPGGLDGLGEELPVRGAGRDDLGGDPGRFADRTGDEQGGGDQVDGDEADRDGGHNSASNQTGSFVPCGAAAVAARSIHGCARWNSRAA
ncbi:hypothetical protein ACIPW5_00610 [Streptomyces sp. NPDC090077]|uniref:hypothetical protein n=1 Tax=Streptomyces sp. NPDC090077 TaxID=3365938 RepID=UPI0037F5AE05